MHIYNMQIHTVQHANTHHAALRYTPCNIQKTQELLLHCSMRKQALDAKMPMQNKQISP